jgi:enamine deaminase RidA (YjgF/YER057c/UK114 family)
MTFDIVNPQSLGKPRGWSNGMLAPAGGRILFIAGQVASDSSGTIPEKISGSFVEQFARALRNIVAVVEEARGKVEDIARFTIFVRDIETYLASRKELGPAYRAVMDAHYPAMTLVEVTRLVDPAAMVEIEATAVIAPRQD